MKRIYIALAFIVLAFSIAVFELCYVSERADYFTEKINISDKFMENGEYASAARLMRDIENEWRESTKIIDILLIHDYVDSIGNEISTMLSYAQRENGDDYFAESTAAKRELASVKESEFVYWENIF